MMGLRVAGQVAMGPLVVALTASAVSGQSAQAWSDELPPLLDRVEEIRLARSAAPAAVTADATVLVLERGGYVEAEAGTNGVTCYVSRTWPGSLEPHCFDGEGSATILQVHLTRARLREEGKTREEADVAVGLALASGDLRLPARPVMSYMMSADQVLFNDDGERVGSWQPHLMIYVPYITSEALGLGGGPPSTDAAIVVDPGTPEANIMVVVKEFAHLPEG